MEGVLIRTVVSFLKYAHCMILARSRHQKQNGGCYCDDLYLFKVLLVYHAPGIENFMAFFLFWFWRA